MTVAARPPLLEEPNDAPASALAGVRDQVACVRAILEEVERVTSSAPAGALADQLVEELARLGCRCLDAASALGPGRAPKN